MHVPASAPTYRRHTAPLTTRLRPVSALITESCTTCSSRPPQAHATRPNPTQPCFPPRPQPPAPPTDEDADAYPAEVESVQELVYLGQLAEALLPPQLLAQLPHALGHHGDGVGVPAGGEEGRRD